MFMGLREKKVGCGERGKHWCERFWLVASHMHPNQHTKHNLSMCPGQGSNLQSFVIQDDALTNWAIRPGQGRHEFWGDTIQPSISPHFPVLWQSQTLTSKSSSYSDCRFLSKLRYSPLRGPALRQKEKEHHTPTPEIHKHCALHPKIKSPPDFLCFYLQCLW